MKNAIKGVGYSEDFQKIKIFLL